jgi:hypothetical protein
MVRARPMTVKTIRRVRMVVLDTFATIPLMTFRAVDNFSLTPAYNSFYALITKKMKILNVPSWLIKKA